MFHLAWFLSYAVQSWNQTWSGAGAQEWVGPRLYRDMAASLERAGFDYMMFEDGSFVPDAYENSMRWALQHAGTVPKHDPLALVASVTAATRNIGVIATVTTAFYPPFLAARLLTTLDHLSGGRVGMNLVTAHNQRTAQNYGLDQHYEHDERYAMADEWVATVSELWDCWAPDALVMNEQTGVFADHTRVRHADVTGRWYRSRGPLNVPPGPQRTPVICQAGGSPAGREFGARNADTILAQAHTVEDMKTYREDISRRAKAVGRDPSQIKVLFLSSFHLADTEQGGHELLNIRRRADNASVEANLAGLSFTTGIDFSAFELDAPLPPITTNNAQGPTELYLRATEGMTLREIASRQMTGAYDFAGTPDSVAAQMGEIAEETGADGFIVQAPAVRRTIAEIADGLAPALRRRGLIRDGYEHGTLRENLLAF